jgi:D-alanyl-lipoteichoic acid acyltransferase DltB (MBOAT superfamily)
MLSTIIDYSFGALVHVKTGKKKKFYLWFSIFNNLAVLGFFKYYNFFAESTQRMLANFGFETHPYFLDIILPVGISFYTFHGMSYVFDIYRGKTVPVRSFIDYAVFVCFFPLLVAGPIERATHLLPQVQSRRVFDKFQAIDGIKMIIWGFFKKVVVADSLAPVVDNIFENYQQYSGVTLLFGAILFAIQIYGDFSGYTDIALGTAKLFGFELITNFRFPYFSRDIAEFWRRWHISLSSWFRDYLYIPLGGSRVGKLKAVRNTFIIFLVSGFWHGANWTYIVWGGFHALLFIPALVMGTNRKNTNEIIGENNIFPSAKECLQIVLTFILVTIAWIFFRAPDISSAFNYLGKTITDIVSPINGNLVFVYDLVMIAILLVYDYWLMKRFKMPAFATVLFYTLLMLFIIGSFRETAFSNQFIYFQF